MKKTKPVTIILTLHLLCFNLRSQPLNVNNPKKINYIFKDNSVITFDVEKDGNLRGIAVQFGTGGPRPCPNPNPIDSLPNYKSGMMLLSKNILFSYQQKNANEIMLQVKSKLNNNTIFTGSYLRDKNNGSYFFSGREYEFNSEVIKKYMKKQSPENTLAFVLMLVDFRCVPKPFSLNP